MTAPCKTCGRDNDDNTHAALEIFGHLSHTYEPAGYDLIQHMHRAREWSLRTFGPGTRTGGVIEHIRRELEEIAENPDDLLEWIDVVILGLDGAWRAGHSPEEIASALEAKQSKNERRSWPDWRSASPDKPIEHISMPSTGGCLLTGCPGVYDAWGRCTTCGDVD